ncbi:hypothetical protein ACFLWZ_04200 [Chloroflexota bacterium]
MHITMRNRIAKLTSTALNPFLVSLAVIILLSFRSTSSILDALKWVLISLGLSTLPVFIVIVFLVHKDKLESISIKVREQRNKIYLLSSICALGSCAVLYYLAAPLVLVATLAAGLLSVVIFMSVNFWWKISIHSAFVAGLVTILIAMYGYIWAVTIVLLPLIGWSRIELEHHSPAQVVSGALLSAFVVFAVFYLFGLVGHSTAV